MHLHAEGLHPGGNFLADATQTQNGQSFAVQLGARVVFSLPRAVFQRRARRRDVPAFQKQKIKINQLFAESNYCTHTQSL